MEKNIKVCLEKRNNNEPVLRPFIAIILYIISSHYIVLSILPIIYSIIINKMIDLEKNIDIYLILDICRSTTGFICVVLIILFFSPFYKTKAFPEVPQETGFFLKITDIMIKKKIIFVLISMIYFIGIYIFCIIFVKTNPYFDIVNKNISNSTYHQDWISILTITEVDNIFFPFSFASIVIFLGIYSFIMIFSIFNSFINFILIPIRYYIWNLNIFK
jgi:hypothetical protein